jgi:hypothetical protein
MGKQTLSAEPNNNNQPYSGSTQSGGGGGSSVQAENQRSLKGSGNKTILYGWKKQCLYVIIFLLMVLISINLALTLWVLKVLEVSKVRRMHTHTHCRHSLKIQFPLVRAERFSLTFCDDKT